MLPKIIQLIFEKEVRSTQDAIIPLLQKNPQMGIFLVAETQNSGRGRKDRDWESPLGGLWGTLGLPLTSKPNIIQFRFLHYIVALTICKVIKRLYGISTQMKWPNDVGIIQKEQKGRVFRKLGGILIELLTISQTNVILFGIGINANNSAQDFPENLQTSAISIKDILQKRISMVELARELKNELILQIMRCLTTDFSDMVAKSILDAINGLLINIDEKMKSKDGKEYICQGISKEGKLKLYDQYVRWDLDIGEATGISLILNEGKITRNS